MVDPNAAQYARRDVVRAYDGYRGLMPPETSILEAYDHRFRGDVLDIGIGGGRTVAPLRDRAATYVGVDYAAEMVALAARDHPGATLEVADARDLRRFADGSFDAVVFSFNGIDSIDHEGRLLVLAEVRRVLRPDGVFVMSSHNRDYHRFNLLPWQRNLRPGRKTLRTSLHALRHLRRHRRMKRQQVLTEEYAIINDEAHDFSLMLYYIGADAQRRQLEDAGFRCLGTWDQAGRRTDSDPGSCWLHYVAAPAAQGSAETVSR